jgi:cobalt-precorrin-5B (C1)-methyltransferase
LACTDQGDGWAEVGITKDAGDDPDVTHGALIVVRVTEHPEQIEFKAGEGVGMVTKAGLPIPVGEPAINPVPRQMMRDIVIAQAQKYSANPFIKITISIPGGEEIAMKTWNGRLGIIGGLSILGTTGVVRPFSCAAWIASIHRGVDVARANNMQHVAGCTGATSEKVVQELYGLTDFAMLDMGDFSGGLLKYIAKNPVPRLTIGGGIGKIVKLAQGAVDLHSSRSQVDFDALNAWADVDVSDANTALEAVERAGDALASRVAQEALKRVKTQLKEIDTQVDIVIIDRAGRILGRAK